MVQPQNWNPPNPEVFIDSTFALVAVIGAIALLFDYTNGFQDAANSMATVVPAFILSPARAAMRAAFFNFIAFFLDTRAVANTVYSGLVDPKQVNERSLQLYSATLEGEIRALLA
jgi:PiT family inorganic phosphate transporter